MDEALWHKCEAPLWPRPTISGGSTSSLGQTWRRKVSGRWEYQQDKETAEEFYERQF